MKSRSFFLRLFGLTIPILLLTLSLTVTGFSGEEAVAPPQVKLTILLVPEKEACKPSGFKAYEEEPASCAPLTLKDIRRWVEVGVPSLTAEIPPGAIFLSKAIFEFLDNYDLQPKSTPEKRFAAVFLFEWDTPQNSTVSLERHVEWKYSKIPPMIWQGLLKDEKYWIHRERADALSPAFKPSWTLTVGNNSWVFHFMKKSQD